LGLKRALVVHGKDGLDEITITGPTYVAEVRNGEVRSYGISPEEFGLRSAPISEIMGGDAKANAEIIRHILEGERSPRRDVVLLNAAAALVVAGRADSISEAMPIAAESIDSKAAQEKLARLVEFTRAGSA
jgi:anthranilate phosphoribosyltransferase